MNPLDALLQALSMIGKGTSPQQLAEIRAAQALATQPGSSVMAQPRPTGSPLQRALGETLNMINPINWMGGMGGASGAVIAPTSNAALQNALGALEQRAPALMQRIKGVPETIYNYLTHQMPSEGAVGTFRASSTLPKGEVHLQAGQSFDDLVTALAHELRHADTAFTPGAARSPERMIETGQQLTAMMPPAQQADMAHYLPATSGVRRNLYSGPTEDVLRKLRGGAVSGVDTVGTTVPGVQPADAYSEAMSYLTESLLNPRGADPMLGDIARALGQNIK